MRRWLRLAICLEMLAICLERLTICILGRKRLGGAPLHLAEPYLHSSPLMGHFYGVTFPPQFSETFLISRRHWLLMKTSLTARLVKAKLLDGPCAILAGWCQCQPGVQTHHEIRAGTLGRCLTTGWGRPKVEPGLDIEPPTGAQPVLLRMVLGSCGTPVSSLLARTGLHCTGQASRGRREEQERKARKQASDIALLPSDKWGSGRRPR